MPNLGVTYITTLQNDGNNDMRLNDPNLDDCDAVGIITTCRLRCAETSFTCADANMGMAGMSTFCKVFRSNYHIRHATRLPPHLRRCVSTGVEVRMRLNCVMRSMLIEINPSYEMYREPDNNVVVKQSRSQS